MFISGKGQSIFDSKDFYRAFQSNKIDSTKRKPFKTALGISEPIFESDICCESWGNSLETCHKNKISPRCNVAVTAVGQF